MKKILIVDDNEDLMKVLSLLLSGDQASKLDLHAVNNLQKALSLMNNICFDLVICDYELCDGLGHKIFQKNIILNNAPFILFTTKTFEQCSGFENLKNQNSMNRYIKKDHSGPDLLEIVNEILGLERTERSYIPIPFNIVESLKTPLDNLYFKLNDKKFIKIVNEGRDYIELISHYREKGIELFYLPLTEASSFLKRVLEKILPSSVEIYKNVQVFNISFDVNEAALKNIGLSDFHLEVTYKTIESLTDIINKKKALGDVLGQLEKTGKFTKDHAILCLFLCTPIVNGLDWKGPETMNKLGMAAFFHNILWSESDVQDREALSKQELEEKGDICLKQAIDHVREIVNVLGPFDEISSDTLTIISEHHENPDGSGYPLGLQGRGISGLSAVFILAHRLACFLLKTEVTSYRVQEFLSSLPKNYREGSFERPYRILESLQKKENLKSHT